MTNKKEDYFYLLNLRYKSSEILYKLQQMHKDISGSITNFKNPNFEQLSGSDVQYLFYLYDMYFFNNCLYTYFNNYTVSKIYFDVSNKMTRAGGKITISKQNKYYIITLSTNLLFKTDFLKRKEVEIEGILCHNRLEASMRIMEHELTHLLEYILYGKTSCAQQRFRDISNKIFGHTGTTHSLGE